MPNIFTPIHQDSKARTMVASSPVVLNVSKKILARQSIFRNVDCNIAHEIKRGHAFLTEQQVKMSTIYQKLLQRIKKAKLRQEEEIKQHQRAMQRMTDEIKYLKASVQQDKVEIWESKNQVMQLEELFDQQMEEYNALCEQIRAEQQEEDDDLDEQDEDENQMQNGESGMFESENGSNQYDSQSHQSKPEEKQEYSKPSCSIKYFISNRSITSPGLSKQNLQVGSGINFHSQQDNGDFSQLYSREQRQQSSTEHNMLSFKKSQHLLCQNP